jgi:hypothetical protein
MDLSRSVYVDYLLWDERIYHELALRILAIRAYERSLEINSGQRRTLAKLIQIHRLTDPQKALREEAQLNTIEAFYGKKSGAT